MKKADLGLKNRKTHNDKNIDALILEHDSVISLADAFYDVYEEQWMKENKPHGFDVQDILIGGLIRRIKHCRKQLSRFIRGVIYEISYNYGRFSRLYSFTG